jgi:hypothetical protein
MCEPTTLAILAIASTGVSMYAQHQTAKAQADAIKVQQEHESSEALERQEEELGVAIREQRAARERARVAAGESGAQGASFIASMNQSIQDQDMDAALAQKNVAFAQRASSDRAATALAGIRDPSALEAGLSMATAGASGYSAGLSIQAKREARNT